MEMELLLWLVASFFAIVLGAGGFGLKQMVNNYAENRKECLDRAQKIHERIDRFDNACIKRPEYEATVSSIREDIGEIKTQVNSFSDKLDQVIISHRH